MSRKSLILATAVLALTILVAGCSSTEGPETEPVGANETTTMDDDAGAEPANQNGTQNGTNGTDTNGTGTTEDGEAGDGGTEDGTTEAALNERSVYDAWADWATPEAEWT